MVCSLKKQGFGWSYFFSITNRPIREQTQVDIISYFADGLATNFALRGHRGGVDDLIWEADKYPSSRPVRYDFSAMPLAGGIVV
jgi:hypothetical protein